MFFNSPCLRILIAMLRVLLFFLYNSVFISYKENNSTLIICIVFGNVSDIKLYCGA